MAERTYPWKIAWITGASGAICGEVARRLAAAGVSVAATARPSERLDQLAASSERITAFPADVLKPDELKAAVAKIEATLGPIDLALLGAGMYVPFDIRNIDLDGFHRTMALNVDGVINAAAAVLPPMLARNSGHIAIMGSLFGYSGWPENGSYGASKAAVINLAESLELELHGTGVDLTLINPGFVDTPLNAAYDPKKKLFVMSPARLRGAHPQEAAAQALRDRLPDQGRAVLEDGALAAARRLLPADPLVHQDFAVGWAKRSVPTSIELHPTTAARGNKNRACGPWGPPALRRAANCWSLTPKARKHLFARQEGRLVEQRHAVALATEIVIGVQELLPVRSPGRGGVDAQGRPFPAIGQERLDILGDGVAHARQIAAIAGMRPRRRCRNRNTPRGCRRSPARGMPTC